MQDLKTSIRKNKGNIFYLIITALFFIFAIKKNIIDLNCTINKSSYHFNLLTINSIFAGFLFTGLSIMISVSDKPRIARLNENGYLDKYYNAIYLSMLFHFISIIASVLLLLMVSNNNLILIERISLIFGIVFFIKSIFNLIKLIKKVKES